MESLLATDENLLKQHGRFKICLLLNNGTMLEHYGREASETMEDMLSGKAKEVLMDARKAYNDCFDFHLQHFSNCLTAVIYRRKYGEWNPVEHFVKGISAAEAVQRFKNAVTRFAVVLNGKTFRLERIGLVDMPTEDEIAQKLLEAI